MSSKLSIQNGNLFRQKWHIKGQGVDLGAELPRIKTPLPEMESFNVACRQCYVKQWYHPP